MGSDCSLIHELARMEKGGHGTRCEGAVTFSVYKLNSLLKVCGLDMNASMASAASGLANQSSRSNGC